jgi:hypothetical protein
VTSNLVRYYSVADRVLCFQGQDEAALELVHSFLSGYYFTPTDEVRKEPDHLIEIRKTAPPTLPPRASGFAIEDGYCFPGNEELLLLVNGSTILVSAPQFKRTDIWISEATSGLHPLALNNVILYAVQAGLRRAGMYQFHAGCVLPGDRTKSIMLVGDSGCGKSTLTATLVSNGWGFASDDNLVLRETETGIVAWALRRYFTFDESTLKACKLLRFANAVGGRVPGDREKFRFYAREAFPQGFVESCSPTIILFPSVTSEPHSRIEPIKQGDALASLIRQCPWATCDPAAAEVHLQVLSRLISQTRSYSIVAGKDVFENPTSISDLIAQIDGRKP